MILDCPGLPVSDFYAGHGIRLMSVTFEAGCETVIQGYWLAAKGHFVCQVVHFGLQGRWSGRGVQVHMLRNDIGHRVKIHGCQLAGAGGGVVGLQPGQVVDQGGGPDKVAIDPAAGVSKGVGYASSGFRYCSAVGH